MRKPEFLHIIRALSLLCIMLSLFLVSVSRRKETIMIPENGFKTSRMFSYTAAVLHRQRPSFDYTVNSLFPRNSGKKTKKTVPEKKTAMEHTAAPSLTFIGIVETGNKKIYSFKDTHTKRLIFLEKGIENNGITLIGDSGTTYTLKIKDRTFQVEKR